MHQWMYNLYYEKEDMLAQYYATGTFPHTFHDKDAGAPRPLAHDPLRFLALHLFFMASSYVMWTGSSGLRQWAGLAF